MSRQLDEKTLMRKVACLYHHQGLTQSQIAKQVGYSRPIISKLLQKSRELGIVEIFIQDETVHTVELEQQIEKRWGLKEAVVVPVTGMLPALIKSAVAAAGARYLSRQLGETERLGISWGTTAAELVKQYPPEKRPNIKIIPLEGGIGRHIVDIHANHIAYELAKRMNGSCSYLYAPAIVESPEIRRNFMEMPDIYSVLEEAASCEAAVIGIGNPLQEESTLQKIGYLGQDDLKELKKAGAVGDIGFRFFNRNGEPIDHSLNERVVGISLDQLKQIPLVIAVMEGSFKRDSITGALNGGLVDVLIIDEPSAVALLKDKEQEG